jgi:ABC-type nitrate/sulfonate/bicarbonate transport system substrate-binding protein
MRIARSITLTFAVLAAALSPALAQDKLTLALGQRGNWDTAVSELGQRAGIFKKHGLVLDILWTQGAGESQQAVLAGSADLGLVGTLQAFAAFKKGVPARIVAAEATGAADYWYARADSAIHSMRDTAGKTVAYSTNGASTHTMVLGFLREAGVSAKPVATGSPSATLTQVMSGQIDVGWSAPPFGLDQINKGQIRVIAYGSDLASVRDQTVRVLMTLADRLDARPAVFARYVQAYRETVAWMYAGDAPLTMYAEFAGVPLAIARQVRDTFFPESLLAPDRVSGLDALMADAVTFKYLPEPLTDHQLSDLIRVPAPPK